MSAGYGVSVWCDGSIKTGRLVRGPRAVGLSLFRRFTTPQGTLRGLTDQSPELAFGFDIASYVGAVGTDTAINALPALMRAHALKDERVLDASASIARDPNADGTIGLTITLRVLLQDSTSSLSLTIDVASDLSVTLLGLTVVA